MKQESLVVCRGDDLFTLTRIEDRALLALQRNATPIAEDHQFGMPWRPACWQPGSLGLAQFFLMMCQLFGDSGNLYDDYKSSFCFPFRLTTKKGERTGEYLVLIGDWKGEPTVRLLRRNAEASSGIASAQGFIDEEFSREDCHYLIDYLEGSLEMLELAYRKVLATEAPDFLNQVPNAQLLYGYQDGTPFEHRFDDEDDFYSMCARLRAELGDWQARLQFDLGWDRAAHSAFTIAAIAKELQRDPRP